MDEQKNEWQFDGHPGIAGWYAVLICYDPEEGVFPSGAYWDGEKWVQKAVVGYMQPPQADLKAASFLAYKHDPDA